MDEKIKTLKIYKECGYHNKQSIVEKYAEKYNVPEIQVCVFEHTEILRGSKLVLPFTIKIIMEE